MKISLLPADIYIVINKSILTEIDKKNLINLYEPIIGIAPVSLYLTLWSDLDKRELMSKDYNHHHLMTVLKSPLDDIKEARKALEAVGLLRTYYKDNDNLKSYVYELYSPLSAYEFLNHPILNVVLYNNIGSNEYKDLINYYKKPTFNYEGYEEITTKMDKCFKTISSINFYNEDINKANTNNIKISNLIDFDLLLESIPNKILSKKALTKKNKELINNLAFIYNLDTLKMSELIRLTINENGLISRDLLLKETRKHFEYNNSGSLPTIIYRSQPDHLKSPEGDLSNKGKMIYIFENTTPYDFLKNKYKNVNPTARDLKLLEFLAVDLRLPPAVINVLVDYVLRINNNKLTKGFVEAIAGQWVRAGVKTAKDAMNIAEKEHKKSIKYKKNAKVNKPLPTWFNKNNETEAMTEEEKVELEQLLSDFR